MKLSEKIYLLRKDKGMTQDELASKCGVSRQSVSKWEATDAKPDIDSIRLLAQTFEMSIDDFLNTDELHPSKLDKKSHSNNGNIKLIFFLIISLIGGLVIGFNLYPKYNETLFMLQEVKLETIQMEDYVQLTVKPSFYDKDVDIEVHLYNSEDLGNNHDPLIIPMNAHSDALAYTAQFSLPTHWNYDVNEVNTLDGYDISINIVSDHFSSKLIPLWNDVWIDDSFDEICMLNNQYHTFSNDAPYYRSKAFYIARSALEQR